MKDNKEKYPNAKDNLYLLSFLDTADRLDILILEIRHLQQSIIDSLHAPTLYLPLRHEEDYIFGGWDDHNACKGKSPAQITDHAILRYPTPSRAVDYWSHDDESEISELKKCLYNRIGEIWTGDVWVRGERQHYFALCALQILKQQIFRDKVQFFQEAKRSNLLKNTSQERYGLKRAAFLILRRGINYRIERHISSLKTQQQNFGKSLDFGLQRYPRPSIDRRREIGIFNDFLSNRAIDLRSDTLHLLEGLVKNKKRDEILSSPMLLHGWSQSMRVNSQQLWDNVGRELDKGDHITASKSTEDISYIDTSFWSPDRPDLQPLVARAIAYSVMRGITKGYSDDYFSNESNPLTDLWVGLSRVLTEATRNKKGVECIHEDSEALLRRLLTDCIAVSVKGISYLYALYLSIMGEGLENLLKIDRITRLEEVYELEGGVRSYEKYYTWYFRLKFTRFWLKECSNFAHLSLSSIDNIVLEGIDQVCEEMLSFLDECSVKSFSSRPISTHELLGQLWRSIYNELEKEAKKSKAIQHVGKWRECRSKDTWDERKSCSGNKVYHRSTMRLDLRLQDFLFRETIHHKKCKNKPLVNIPEDLLLDIFGETYKLNIDKEAVPYTKAKVKKAKNIYRQLHDIPFQCSIMRSMDILGQSNNKPIPWKSFVDQSHRDMSLGREIFSFALEYYTWSRESPKSRLLLSINLLSFLLPLLKIEKLKLKNENALLKLTEALDFWMYAEKIEREEDKVDIKEGVDKVVSVIKNCSHQALIRQYKNRVKGDLLFRRYANGVKGDLNVKRISDLGAVQIDEAFSYKDMSVANKRRLEQLSGYKIQELQEILDILVQEQFIEDLNAQKVLHAHLKKELESEASADKIVNNLCMLGNLREFLQIRDDSEKKPAAEGRFYQLLLKAFGGKAYKPGGNESKNLPNLIEPIIVTRLAVTSYYSVANPRRVYAEDKNKNGLGLADILKQDSWSMPLKTENQEFRPKYVVLLGRYDVVSFIPSRLPCRCRISHFSNDTGANEKFATHFSRREVALPMELYGNCDINDNSYTTYAISSVSLQRRSMRLNLLYRLLNARHSDHRQIFSSTSVEEKLRTIIRKFGRDDDSFVIKSLLTDGWGDLLLVFMYKKETIDVSALHEYILQLQQALYEDFMIDRTELIYTPHCLDYMMASEDYSFSLLFRFQEDRKLERSIQNFVDALHEKAKLLDTKYGLDYGYEIAFTPGQYDIRLSLEATSNKSTDDIYRKIVEWLADKGEDNDLYNRWYRDGLSHIDKVETAIEKLSPDQLSLKLSTT